MTETILAEAAIEVGHHETAKWFGLTVNTDTVLVHRDRRGHRDRAGILPARQGHVDRRARRRAALLRSHHHPDAQSDRGHDRHADRAVRAAAGGDAVRLHPGRELALGACPCSTPTPTGATHELLKPPASDINFVLALALFVFIAYHAAGIWRRGLFGHPKKVLKGHVAFLAPDQPRRRNRQADLVVAPTFRQHLRRRHPGRADRAVPAVDHVGAQRDLEDFRPVRRRHPGVHLRPVDDPVLQPIDGTR